MRLPGLPSAWSVLVATLCCGCGAGTAAVLDGASGGGATNTAPSVTGLTLLDGHGPQARLRLFLVDAQGDSAVVRFWYQASGGAARRALHVEGSDDGTFVWSPGAHEVTWAWAAEADLPASGSLVQGVRVWALVDGGTAAAQEGVNALTIALGNDPPRIDHLHVGASEGTGNVPITYAVLDSTADLASVEFQYRLVTDPVDTWSPMHSPGSGADLVCNIETSCDEQAECGPGIEHTFVWDTAFDLSGKEVDTWIRAVPRDGACSVERASSTGVPFVMSKTFRVDNNEPPLVVLRNGEFLAQSDARRVLQVPIRCIDAEGDPAGLVVQWRAPGETFPTLDVLTPLDLEARLADPAWRRSKHICTEAPREFDGRVGPVLAGSNVPGRVRMPELATSEAAALGLGPGAWELEFEPSRGQYAQGSWPMSPGSIVGAVPLAEGEEALVLVSTASGWELTRRDTWTGAALALPLASGPGAPRALFVDDSEQHAFLGIDGPSGGTISKIRTADGHLERSLSFGGTEPIRGVCTIGSETLVVVTASSLWTASTIESSTSWCPVVHDLDDARAVVPLPKSDVDVYVAEAGHRRLLLVDVAQHTSIDLAIRSERGAEPALIPAPQALAIDPVHGQLLVASLTSEGMAEVRSLELSRTSTKSQPIGGQSMWHTEMTLPGTSVVVGVGRARGARIVATNLSPRVWLQGVPGVAKLEVDPGRVSLATYDGATQTIDPGAALEPKPSVGDRWRLRSRTLRLHGSPGGTDGTFAWDTRDLGSVRSAYLRAVGFDADFGTPSEGLNAKTVADALEADVERIGVAAQVNPSSVHVADMDADGDADVLVAAGLSHNVLVFYQDGSGAFRVDGGSQDVNWIQFGPCFYPNAVTPADLDADGDLDVVVACDSGPGISLWYQHPNRRFEFERYIGTYSGTNSPAIRDSVVADLDADGRPDIVTPYHGTNRIQVHLQGPGGFVDAASLELSGALLNGPRSVEAVDLDGDCLLDLVATTDTRLLLFHQMPSHQFSSQPSVPATGSVVPQSTTTRDFDGDGDPEIALLVGLPNPGIQILERTSARTFMISQILSLPASSSQLEPKRLGVLDLDADGDLDLVVSARAFNAEDGALVSYSQIAPGQYAPGRIIGTDPNAQAPSALAIGDIDGDADMDIAWTSDPFVGVGDSTAILRADSPGRLGVGPAGHVSVSALGLKTSTAIEVADLDHDGDEDIVAVGLSVPVPPFGPAIAILFQTTPEQFEPASSSTGLLGTLPTYPSDVGVADFDGDRDLDLAITDLVGNRVIVYEQTTPGRFGGTGHETVLSGAGSFPNSLAVADFDNDGRIDVATANAGSHDLTVFRQTTRGRFVHDPTHDRLAVPGSSPLPLTLVGADLGFDGDVDLVCASRDANQVCVFRAVAPGVWQQPPLVLGDATMTPKPRGLACDDVDGDGLLDVIVGCEGDASGARVVLFSGTVDGSIAPSPAATWSDGTKMLGTLAVETGDIDGDGRRDVLCANRDSNNASFFRRRVSGGLEVSTTHYPTLGTVSVSCLDVADLDGDQEADVVLGVNHGGNPRIEILYGGR